MQTKKNRKAKNFDFGKEVFNLSDFTFVITDIETTGPIKGKDRIIEIAAVKVKKGKIESRFESLVNPEKPISGIITNLTGINFQMVHNQPTIEKVLPEYLNFLGDSIFVAHNSAFDYNFINSEADRLGLKSLEGNVELCTLKLANKFLPHVRAKGLNGLARHFNYTIENRHRAMSDVLATKYFFDQFVKIAERNVFGLS